jgi:tetratricopeptide (TPR) repeat protein
MAPPPSSPTATPVAAAPAVAAPVAPAVAPLEHRAPPPFLGGSATATPVSPRGPRAPTPVPRAPVEAPTIDASVIAKDLEHAHPETHAAIAREMIATFEKELGSSPKPARAGRLHYECARLFEWPLGETPRAAEHFQKAHALTPDHLPTVRGARRTLVASKRPQLALALFDAEVKLTSDPQQKAVLLYEKGMLLEDALGQRREAREAYQAGLDLDPANTSLLKAVERADIAAKAWESLDKTYERAANAVTGDPRLKAAVIAERARIVEARRGDVRSATELYRLALETDSRTTAAIHALKRLCFGEERFGDLVAVLAHEAELVTDPGARALAFYRAGRVLSDRLGALDKAAEAFEGAARETPTDRVVLAELARVYEFGKAWPKLVAVLERLAAQSEKPAEKVGYFQRIGQISEERLENDAAAIVWYEQARSEDPLYLPAIQALSKLYTKQKNWNALLAVHEGEATGGIDTARRAAAHARMAEIFERELNDATRAAEHHSQALGLVPGYSPSFKALERLLALGKRFQELVELYERGVDLAADPETKITWLFKIGRLQEDALGEPGHAVTTFRRILEVDPQHLGAIHAVQRAAERAGRYRDLVDGLELEVARVADKKKRLELLHRAGEVCELSLEDEAGALSFYRRAFELDKGYTPALAGLGRVHYKAGRWDGLLETYRAELEHSPLGPATAALHFKTGELYEERLGKDEEAIAAYRRAIQADPSHRPALTALERKLGEKGRWDELAKLIETEIGAAPTAIDKSRGWFRAAEVLENRLKQLDKARTAYEHSLAADPTFRPAREGLIRLLTLGREWKRLVEELEHEVKGAPDPAISVAALLRQAEVYRDELGDAAHAIACFEAVLERDPAHVEALLGLEPLYVEKGAWDALAKLYATEARVFSDSGARIAVLRELARLEERRAGDDLGAVRDAELMVLQLSPSDPAALAALQRLALRAGDPALVGQVDAQLANAGVPSLAAEHTTRLAELLESTGDASALGLFRSALSRDPESIAAARGFARMAERLGDPRLLEEAAARLVEVALDRAGAARMLVRAAEVQSNGGDRAAAAALLECALEYSPEQEAAATLLVALLSGAADTDRLLRALTQAATEAVQRDRVAALWIQVAELHATRRRDLPAGLAALQRALTVSPGHVGTLMKLAELYVRDGQWAEAADRLRQVVSQTSVPEAMRLDAHARLAAILDERLADPERARASVEAVLAADPRHPAALGRLVQLEIRRGRLDAASEAAGRLVKTATEPEDRAEALLALARVETARGRIGAAGEAYAEAVAIVGLEGDAASGLRELISRVPRKADAPTWEVYATALTRHLDSVGGNATADVYHELARVLGESLNRPDQAIQMLERSVALSDDPAVQAELANRLLEAGNPQKAVQALRHVFERDVGNAAAWRKLSECFKALGRRAESNLALAPLAALGQANDLELLTLSQTPPRPASLPSRSLDGAELQSIALVPPTDPAARLLAALSDVLEKLYPPELERYGISSRDRLGARSGNPIRSLSDRIAGIFGVGEFDLYVHGSHAVAVEVEFTDPVSILVPPFVTKLSESGQAFALGRVFAALSLKLHAVEKLSPDQLELLLAGAARNEVPGSPASAAGEEATQTMAKRVSRALPWIGRGGIDDAARVYATAPRTDLVELAARIRLGAARAALLVSDDLPAAVLVTRQAEGDLSSAPGTARAWGARVVNDLMGFWVSEGALSVRRRLGLL